MKPATVGSVCLNRHAEALQTEKTIVFQIRLPRVLAAALVGCALSIAGVLFQGLFRNPMADPYVIGTQGGAALGATIGVVLMPHVSLLGFGATASLAFCFSLLTMVAVYWLARVVGSLLTAAAVAIGGLIGFVGLVIPHLVRLLVGPDHVRLLPIAGLAGAVFLILADTLARTVLSPSELPVGILTAFVGGPVFLFLLRPAQRGGAPCEHCSQFALFASLSAPPGFFTGISVAYT